MTNPNITVDTKADTIEVNGVKYGYTTTDEDHGMTTIVTVDGFPEIEAQRKYEEYIDSSQGLDWTRVGTMLCGHRNYELGDEQDIPDFEKTCIVCDGHGTHPTIYNLMRREPGDWYGTVVGAGSHEAMEAAEELTERFQPADSTATYFVQNAECNICEGRGVVECTPTEWAKAERGATVVLPLYLMDHSGLSISTGAFGCPWDSGQLGIIFDTPESRKETGCTTVEEVTAAMKAEVEEYDKWIRGDVHFISIESPGYDETVGGFAGDEYAMQELLEMVGHAIHDTLQERINKHDAACRDIVTV